MMLIELSEMLVPINALNCVVPRQLQARSMHAPFCSCRLPPVPRVGCRQILKGKPAAARGQAVLRMFWLSSNHMVIWFGGRNLNRLPPVPNWIASPATQKPDCERRDCVARSNVTVRGPVVRFWPLAIVAVAADVSPAYTSGVSAKNRSSDAAVLAESGCIISPFGPRLPMAREWQRAMKADTSRAASR